MADSANPPETQVAALPKRRPHERWPTTSTFPAQVPDLRVVFHGLLSFCYTDRGHAEVGVFDASAEHKLRIKISGGTCDDRIYTGIQLSKGDFILEVTGDLPQGVSSFQTGAEFNRLDNENTSPNDFRWMLDLEGPDIYDSFIINKRPSHYRPRLFVRSGLFYTIEKTGSTFRAENDDGTVKRDVGNIAFCTGCNIYLKTGQQAVLTLKRADGEDITCRFDKTGSLQKIYFTNTCRLAGGGECPDPDFGRHFDSFDPPGGQRKFKLVAVKKEKIPHDCSGLSRSLQESTDEAPCGGVGYGGTTSIPN